MRPADSRTHKEPPVTMNGASPFDDDTMIDYQREDAKRRLVWTVEGDVTLDEILAATDRQAAEGAWNYSLLYDARLRRGALTRDEIRRFANCVGQHTKQHGQRGRVAILTQPEAYGMSRMYSLIGQLLDGENRVFRDLADAQRWLDEA